MSGGQNVTSVGGRGGEWGGEVDWGFIGLGFVEVQIGLV